MTILQGIILGVIQGATEFIPVSSSGHLVLAPWLLGWQFEPEAAFAFDVLVQMGTLLAVIAYFWRDLREIALAMAAGLLQGKPLEESRARLGWLILAATAPAGVIGLVFKDFFERNFGDPAQAAIQLLVTAALLAASEWMVGRAPRQEDPRLSDAIAIGFWQALSILPGISRSGATIAGGLTRGLRREAAARFSFLMSIPVMLGAGGLAFKDLVQDGGLSSLLPALIAGFLAAAVVGFATIAWLQRYLRAHPLYVFAAYCAAFGVACLLVAWLRG